MHTEPTSAGLIPVRVSILDIYARATTRYPVAVAYTKWQGSYESGYV